MKNEGTCVVMQNQSQREGWYIIRQRGRSPLLVPHFLYFQHSPHLRWQHSDVQNCWNNASWLESSEMCPRLLTGLQCYWVIVFQIQLRSEE